MVRAAVTHAILFIAAISVAAVVAGLVVSEAGSYAQSVEDESERDVAAIDAEIEIVNDPEAGATYDETEETVTVYVKNVGGSTLQPGDATVLLNGEYAEPDETRVLGTETDEWRVDAVLELTIEIDGGLEGEDHRVVVEADEARDRLSFAAA